VRSPELDRTSVALLSSGEGVRRSVWQVSERAHEAGVRTGQLISQAVSLCPSLTLLEPDPAHYDAAVDAMLEALADNTPVVEPAGERGKVFLGMDGLGRLYGSPPNQVRHMLRALFRVFPAPLVAATRAGMAPGTFGAWVAAVRSHAGKPVIVGDEELADFLAGCPVGALPVDAEMVERLERLGVKTLGALARLPEPALVAQFGQDGRDALAWATGRRVDAVRAWHRPRPIRVSLDFPAPAGQVELLHGAVDRLLERALARPARRGRSVHTLRLTASLEEGGSWSVDAVLREPSAKRDRLAFLLRSRMQLTPPPRAVESLGLELVRFGPPASQDDLFGRDDAAGRDAGGRSLADGAVPASLRRAVRELRLRLGHSPLYRVVELDPWSRIPERRHALLSFEP
jgi:nucleotidyltransferase/DNA polymerase involved in DNA repair